MPQNNHRVGIRQEEIAAEYLREQGYLILEHNYHTRTGEIDLIGLDGHTLAFIEVKYRSSKGSGDPGESITPYKQSKIRRCAMDYLARNRYAEDTPCRFDAVLIFGTQIRLIKDAV